jgi:hypothetical protein
VPQIRVGFNFPAQAGEVLAFFCGSDFVGFDVKNFIEYVGHGFLL